MMANVSLLNREWLLFLLILKIVYWVVPYKVNLRFCERQVDQDVRWVWTCTNRCYSVH